MKLYSQLAQWLIALLPGIIGLLMFASFGLWLAAVLLVAGSAGLIMFCLTEIPASPPHVGLLTIWGKRTWGKEKEAVVVEEGLKLFLKIFPLLIDTILIKVERENRNFEYASVRCRLASNPHDNGDTTAPETVDAEEDIPSEVPETEDGWGQDVFLKMIQEKFKSPQNFGEPEAGGEVKLSIGITYVPEHRNPERLIQFVNSGQRKGVEEIIDKVLGEDVRQIGRFITWVEYSFATDFLSTLFVHRLTGALLPRLGDDGTETGEKVHPFDATRVEITYFLDKILTNGLSDIRDLGITITRLNLADVSPVGKLAEDAELAARERQQQAQRLQEIKSRMAEIAAVKAAGGSRVKFEDIWQILRVEDDKAIEHVIRGSGGSVDTLAAALFDGGRKS